MTEGSRHRLFSQGSMSRRYRVRLGDSLPRLAEEFQVDLDALIELNDIQDVRLIWVGQELILPQADGVPIFGGLPATSLATPVPRPPAASVRRSSEDTFPWVGRVKPWSAALREGPQKTRATLMDVPRGTKVVVMGAESGWLRVRVDLGARRRTGFISRELLDYDHAISLTLREALVVLKRAETAFRIKAPSAQAAVDVWVSTALKVVQATGRYVVDERTYTVSFASSKERIKINTLEDFILFVEEVERQYPAAKPQEIAAEIRQVWFSDANWEMLSAGTGVSSRGVEADIETRPNPVAVRFDMADLSPSASELTKGKKNKRLVTSMGAVDISHVIAGIDVRLNGFPATYPKAYLEQHGHDSWLKSERMYETLKKACGGDANDFATWSGDLGQAYADFLVSRYVKQERTTLASFVATRADEGAMLGDIHGYIAVEVWKSIPEAESPTGREDKVSNHLRALYLLDVDGIKKGATYRRFFENAAGKKSSELKDFIRERILAFSRPWFAKQAYAHRGYWSSDGVLPGSLLSKAMSEFDSTHAKHVKAGKADEQLDGLVDKLLNTLSNKLQ